MSGTNLTFPLLIRRHHSIWKQCLFWSVSLQISWDEFVMLHSIWTRSSDLLLGLVAFKEATMLISKPSRNNSKNRSKRKEREKKKSRPAWQQHSMIHKQEIEHWCVIFIRCRITWLKVRLNHYLNPKPCSQKRNRRDGAYIHPCKHYHIYVNIWVTRGRIIK